MVDPDLDAVFQALAHPVRRGLLARLAGGELTVGELAAPLDMSLAAASKHLDVLERAGLVRRAARGRSRVCSLDPEPLRRAAGWLALDVTPPPQPQADEEPAAETVFRSGPVPDG
jgi:DNA-binding transcriptional ArsR family regulator